LGQIMITVYVLQSTENGKRYVGITNNLSRRLTEHRCKESKAGQLLYSFELIYTEEVSEYTEARLREKFLKSGSGREWLSHKIPRSRPASGG
jgi:putative endonuclease